MIARPLCAALLAAVVLVAMAPAVARGADDATVVSCAGVSSSPIHFGAITASSDRATFEGVVVVTCAPHASYRLRLVSVNDCRMLGPKREEIRYEVFTDPAYRSPALDCTGFPIELDGTGTTTFRLYARTQKLVRFAFGNYRDVIYMDVMKDKDDTR